MKALKWLSIALLGLVAIFVAGAFLMPATYRVERVATINAPASKIYPLVASPRNWTKWTVWNRREPDMKMTFSGAEMGKDARWEWVGKDGRGTMEFTGAQPDRAIEYRLGFPEMNMTSTGAITLAPSGDATRVSWTNEGDAGGSLLMRWFMPFMDSMMGPDFEAGLANLKALAEQGAVR